MQQQEYEALGEITDDGLTLHDREHFRRALQRFPRGPVVVNVQVYREKRSSAQNRYWHGVVVPVFAEHCGYSVPEMKDVLALKLIPKDVTDPKTGEVHTVPGHTSDLTPKEFADLIDRAMQLAAEWGLYLPAPGEAMRVA